jgi:hypothetical protein
VYAVYEADDTLNATFDTAEAARRHADAHPGWTWGAYTPPTRRPTKDGHFTDEALRDMAAQDDALDFSDYRGDW